MGVFLSLLFVSFLFSIFQVMISLYLCPGMMHVEMFEWQETRGLIWWCMLYPVPHCIHGFDVVLSRERLFVQIMQP